MVVSKSMVFATAVVILLQILGSVAESASSGSPVVVPPTPPNSNKNGDYDCLVVGAGSIGSSFCAFFLAQGKKIICLDPHVEESMLHERICKLWPTIRARGLTRQRRPPLQFVKFEKDLETAISGPDGTTASSSISFIQECTFENVQSKQRILAELDRLADPHVIISSSTSFIPHELLITNCINKDRILVGHPSMPHLDCFMEVYGTSIDHVDRAQEWYRRTGFDVVVMKKTITGHVFNSFLTMNLRHGCDLVKRGVCTPQDVNTVLRHLGRDWYGRHAYLTLLSTVGGDRGLDGGLQLSDSIKCSAVSVVFFSLMKKLWMPDFVANAVGRLMSKLLTNVLEPPPPPEWIDACRELQDRLTKAGELDVQTGLFQACSDMYDRMPYEVENDPFQL